MTQPLDKLNSITNSQSSPEDEINLIDVLGILVGKKLLILLSTLIFIALSISYVIFATPIYQVEVAFLEPPESIIPKSFLGKDHNKPKKKGDENIDLRFLPYFFNLMKNSEETIDSDQVFYNETNKSLYFKFLTRIQSYKHQKTVFDTGGFLKKFSGYSDNSHSPKDYFLKIHESISLKKKPEMESQKIKKGEFRKFETPFYLSMRGSKPDVMSEFMNAISLKASEDIKSETLQLVKKKIEVALQDNDRKAKILSSTIQLDKKLILSRIEQEYKERLRVLSDSMILAKNLKIKNNNFSLLGKNESLQVIMAGDSIDPRMKSREQKTPIWFLYGELALKKEIEILKSKVNDKYYIENKADLEYKFEQLETSKILKKAGKKFSFTNNELLNQLAMKKMKLELLNLSQIQLEIAVISQPGITPSHPIEPNKLKTVLIGAGFGLFLGLLTAFFKHALDALRKQDISPL
jgi:LPS O-antigen subunit length determinant protein (WzzB/FepE family)